jgi:hypothetical protein
MVFPKEYESQKEEEMSKMDKTNMGNSSRQNNITASNIKNLQDANIEEIEKMLIRPVNLTPEQMLDEAQAFEQFRRSYRRHEAM